MEVNNFKRGRGMTKKVFNRRRQEMMQYKSM